MEQKKKFNLVDIIILAVIVVAAGVFIWQYATRAPVEETPEPEIEYRKLTMVMHNYEVSDDFFANGKIAVGDPAVERSTGISFGTVTDIETKESRSYGVDMEGNWVQSPKPQTSHVIITIEGICNLPEENGGILLDGLLVFNNKEFEINIRDSAFWLRVVDYTVGEVVEKIEEDD